MKPKIYISHPETSIEEVAKRAGVSKRRLKELKVIIADVIESESPRRSKPAAHKRPKRIAAAKRTPMKPKIYISHPNPSIEQVAKMVGVSKRRLKELKVIIADVIEAEAPRRSRRTGKQSAHKRSKPTVSR
jgi:hypothetical protein